MVYDAPLQIEKSRRVRNASRTVQGRRPDVGGSGTTASTPTRAPSFANSAHVRAALGLDGAALARDGALAPRAAQHTPYLDAVEAELRKVSPGLEHRTWERTDGNLLEGAAGDWLLQVPGSWGDAEGVGKPGIDRLLEKIEQDISRAEHSVDISTLLGDPFMIGVWPGGRFKEAVLNGLRRAVEGRPADAPRLKVRFLGGTLPLLGNFATPTTFLAKLRTGLGEEPFKKIDVNVAAMLTSRLPGDQSWTHAGVAWNHSKLIIVDGRTAITGGINNYRTNYIDTTHPVQDVDLALTGPAALSAAQYLDTLWEWAYRKRGNGPKAKAWLAKSKGAHYMMSLPRAEAARARDGGVAVLSVGGLGLGILKKDPQSHYELPPCAKPEAAKGSWQDHTSRDRDYATVNPDQTALRTLIAAARTNIVLSQQDLNGMRSPIGDMPSYDVRLFDILAAKLNEGVKVRIAISTPGNEYNYSNIASFEEIRRPLRERLALHLGGDGPAHHELAESKMRAHLQLASVANAAPVAEQDGKDPGDGTGSKGRWADGKTCANHSKLVAVDDTAFYIGSKNLYPAWLQDHGYIVEDRAASRQLREHLLDPQWKYSKGTAYYDWETGTYPDDAL
ncbi:phospholipase [Streptomyces sp. NPDC002506]|uniref:phospholipase n=1 Tax=Streptomyces sp. NPDC002506 TaxID=3154536 RepID=UPI00331E73CD